MSINIGPPSVEELRPRITVIGVGGAGGNAIANMIASEIEGTTHDLISGVYSLRMLPLKVGETYNLKISDSGLVYDVPVRVTARERQKTEIGKVMCFRVEPDVFGPGRLVEGNGRMVIWITDDARRIPVRSQVNASIGKIDIKIKSLTNTKTSDQTARKD